MFLIRPYFLIMIFSLSALSVTYFLFPELRGQLLEEDQFVENTTVMIYLSVVGLAVCGFFVGKRKMSKLFILFIAFGAFVALEEISYGERIFGLIAPRILDYKMDTLHDGFFLSFKAVKVLYENYGIFVLVVVAGLGAIGLYFLYRVKDRWIALLLQLVRDPPFFYIGLFVLLGFIALLLDLGIVKHGFLQVLEEGLEMNAGLALLFATISAICTRKVSG